MIPPEQMPEVAGRWDWPVERHRAPDRFVFDCQVKRIEREWCAPVELLRLWAVDRTEVRPPSTEAGSLATPWTCTCRRRADWSWLQDWVGHLTSREQGHPPPEAAVRQLYQIDQQVRLEEVSVRRTKGNGSSDRKDLPRRISDFLPKWPLPCEPIRFDRLCSRQLRLVLVRLPVLPGWCSASAGWPCRNGGRKSWPLLETLEPAETSERIAAEEDDVVGVDVDRVGSEAKLAVQVLVEVLAEVLAASLASLSDPTE